MDLLPLATMPRVGSEYYTVEAESASSSYRRTPRQNASTNNMVDLSSDNGVSEDTEDGEDEAYNPVHGGWISEESDDSRTHVNSNEIHINEEEDIDLNDVENAVKDENGIVETTRRGVPFVADPSGKIRLVVGQLFQKLHQFKQRIKNERDRYTAECAYKGCGWRIHGSPIDDRRTFMIKTMEPQHSCQKVHKIQEANAVWVARRVSFPVWTLYWVKRRVLEKTKVMNCESYSMLHTYGNIVREMNPGSMITTGAGCISFEGLLQLQVPNQSLHLPLYILISLNHSQCNIHHLQLIHTVFVHHVSKFCANNMGCLSRKGGTVKHFVRDLVHGNHFVS
ncbi:hypothetical protein ACOSP7_016900 [Xanthoceras sorbifolium]